MIIKRKKAIKAAKDVNVCQEVPTVFFHAPFGTTAVKDGAEAPAGKRLEPNFPEYFSKRTFPPFKRDWMRRFCYLKMIHLAVSETARP